MLRKKEFINMKHIGKTGIRLKITIFLKQKPTQNHIKN